MSPWKYTDQSRLVAFRILANDGIESRLASQITDPISPPDAPTKAETKAAALAAATALGFSLDQLRVIRAIVMLTSGNPAQKTKAAALLQPLVKLAGDARVISDRIDADQVPATLTPAIIPTDDP